MPGEGAEVPVDLRDIETRIQECGHEELHKRFEEINRQRDDLVLRKARIVHPNLGFFRLSPDAILPTRATEHSACWDVYSVDDLLLIGSEGDPKHGIITRNFCVAKTGWRLVIPEGYRVDVRARSGLAAKNGVTVLNAPGTIDRDYEGELMIILGTVSTDRTCIKKGERIAQIALERVQEFTVREVGEDELPTIDSSRGDGGLGSTGM